MNNVKFLTAIRIYTLIAISLPYKFFEILSPFYTVRCTRGASLPHWVVVAQHFLARHLTHASTAPMTYLKTTKRGLVDMACRTS